jgi:hypothetical protein
MKRKTAMPKPLYAYLYGGATCEDLYAASYNPDHDLSLEHLATPQCAFIATRYSQELINELARDMWAEIEEIYRPNNFNIPGVASWTFEDLEVVTSSRSFESPEDASPLAIQEGTVIEYCLPPVPHPLIQIVVQARRIR